MSPEFVLRFCLLMVVAFGPFLFMACGIYGYRYWRQLKKRDGDLR
jgi:hypothetical protein